MDAPLLRLYPTPAEMLALRGLYLAHDLRAAAGGGPFVYTNFVASLDGRIAQLDPVTRRRRVPPAIANARDWRLYQELAAQADAVVTTARHLRAAVAALPADLLALDPELRDWRQARQLTAEPVLAVLSARLDIPVQQLPERHRRRLLVITGAAADAQARQRLTQAGVEVMAVGKGEHPSGHELLAALAGRGLPLLYSVAGPRVHRLLLDARVIDRLYLTTVLRALGGETVDTLVEGPALAPPIGFVTETLYLDPHGPGDVEQLFLCLRRHEPSAYTG